MQILRQAGGSLLLAIFSVVLVMGGISLALAEVYVPDNPTPTATPEQILVISSPTVQQTAFIVDTPTSSPTATIPPPTSCPPPTGWIPITVQSSDTLAILAARYNVSADLISAANCLFSTDLRTGTILYVPPIPTPTDIPCGPPAGWVSYVVQRGDTMYSLSHAYGVSIPQLQFANCIPAFQYNLSVGQILRVPNVPVTRTPFPTATATLTPVSIIFPTVTKPVTATSTATIIPTGTTPSTPTATPTATTPPTSTATVASPTTSPTSTATITAFPTSTWTPNP